MKTPQKGARHCAPSFLPKNTERARNAEKPHRVKKTAQPFTDGIVRGERVLIAESPTETEKGVELRIRVALAAAGVLVWKHTVEVCYACATKPTARTGLGTGASDLICVVPPHGRFLGIEVKHPTDGRTSQAQTCWLAVVRRFGGITGVARSVDEAMALVTEARGQ